MAGFVIVLVVVLVLEIFLSAFELPWPECLAQQLCLFAQVSSARRRIGGYHRIGLATCRARRPCEGGSEAALHIYLHQVLRI